MNKILLVLMLFSNTAFGLEKDYQKKYCTGKLEVVLPDRSRVDCLTDTHAIEYEFAFNWHHSIGQSLHYAMITGKRAGVVLIVDAAKKEEMFVNKLKAVIKFYGLPIDVFIVSAN